MTIPVGSLVTSAAGSAHPVIISRRRRRPADSRPAACRIIRGSDADGAISEGVHISAASALGDAINLLLYGAGVGVDGDRPHDDGIFLLVQTLATELLERWIGAGRGSDTAR
jgi:hypothetical protein